VAEISFTYLNGPDIAALEMADQEILDAVEAGLRAQGRGETVIEPRVHLEPDPAFRGHFNVLRGYVAPLGLAGVKIVGDYIDNYQKGLPSEMALLNLFDPRTGMPLALLDATAITEMRTGALTALGAKYLARSDSRVLGHIGARGTAYWNVRLIDRLFDLAEIRVHSRRSESRAAFAERLSRDLGKEVIAVESWEGTFRSKPPALTGLNPCSAQTGSAAARWSFPTAPSPPSILTSPTPWTRSWWTTGASAMRASWAPCDATWRPAGSARRASMANSARSSPARSRAGKATVRHRPGGRYAGQGQAPWHRPGAPLRLTFATGG
jgi:hypothetical protein